LSLRTPYIDAAHAFVPTEAMQEQRYFCDHDAGQYGLVYYFPSGPIPQAKIGTDISYLPNQEQSRAEGWAARRPWAKLYPWGNNKAYTDSSPWGAAIRFHQPDLWSNDAACLHCRLSSGWEELGNVSASYPFHHTIFLIAKASDGAPGVGQGRYLLTHFVGIFEFMEVGYAHPSGLLTLTIGNAAITGKTTINFNVASRLRSDGWLRIAIQHRATSIAAGTVDIWFEGEKVVDSANAPYNSVSYTSAMIAGGNIGRKDGFGWHGLIAQLACVLTGSVAMSDDQIRKWFDDPWWFMKAERSFFIPSPRCPYGEMSVEPACDAEMSLEAAAAGDVSVEPACDAEISIEPAAVGEFSIEPACDAEISICSRGVS